MSTDHYVVCRKCMKMAFAYTFHASSSGSHDFGHFLLDHSTCGDLLLVSEHHQLVEDINLSDMAKEDQT